LQVAQYLLRSPASPVAAALATFSAGGGGGGGGGGKGRGKGQEEALETDYLERREEDEGGAMSVCVHLRSFLMSKQELTMALQCAVRLANSTSAHTHARTRTRGSILVSADERSAATFAATTLEGLVAGIKKSGDADGVEWRVLQHFGRETSEEVVHGLAALFRLSRCSQLVGTSRSTFALLAAALSSASKTAAFGHAEFAFVDVHDGKCVAKMCRLPPAPPDCWPQAPLA
jgi:hypothetical protein